MMAFVVLSLVGAAALGAAYAYFIELGALRPKTKAAPSPPPQS